VKLHLVTSNNEDFIESEQVKDAFEQMTYSLESIGILLLSLMIFYMTVPLN
jgi:hypothetical protein